MRLRLPKLPFLAGFAPEPGPIRLHQRRIYILPTRQGWMFASILLAILIGAINYQNSLAFALVFLLAGLGAVTMLHTWRNLLGLQVHSGRCQAVFAGETASFQFALDNPTPLPRAALQLQFPAGDARLVDLSTGIHWLALQRPATQRGLLPAGRLTVETRYPLGLFRAWAPLHPQQDCLIYPAPAAGGTLPPGTAGASGSSGVQGSGLDDFAGLRSYQPGDSLRHVHWKAAARGQGLFTKQFSGETAEELWLDWNALPGLDNEARLSQLCRWVLDAEQGGHRYGLRLPNQEIPLASGPPQQRRCLEALALFGVRT